MLWKQWIHLWRRLLYRERGTCPFKDYYKVINHTPAQAAIMWVLVYLPAVFPYLSTWSSERTNVAHLHHRCTEIGEEFCHVWWIGGSLGVCWASIEQLLVRMQNALLVQQVLVVEIVKNIGCWGVKGGDVIVTSLVWTIWLQWCCKGCVNVSFAVNAVAEVDTSGLPNGVASWQFFVLCQSVFSSTTIRFQHLAFDYFFMNHLYGWWQNLQSFSTWECNHVSCSQSFVWEGLGKITEVKGWLWNIIVCSI